MTKPKEMGVAQAAEELTVAAMRLALVAEGVRTDEQVRAIPDSRIRTLYDQAIAKKTAAKEHVQEGPDMPGSFQDAHPTDEREPNDNQPKITFGQFVPSPVQRQTVTSDRLRDAVEELLGKSDSLSKAVKTALLEHLDEMAEAIGLPDQMRQLRDDLVKDLKDAADAQMSKLEEWMRRVEEKATTRHVFTFPDMPAITVEDQHYRFPDLLFNAVHRKATMMVGPSGSGKTRAMMEIARVLKMEFSYTPLGPTQTESRFAGFQNAEGIYIPTEFYLRYRYGGVLGLDEIDAANPSVLVWVNGAISNRIAGFPRGFMSQLEQEGFVKDAKKLREAGGMVPMHPDCIILASANTYGKGADMVYQGRNALDGATLKRFKVITWDYDESLERKLAPLDEWTDYVQLVRRAVDALQMHHIVSPVDSIDGGQMILAGKPWRTVASETVFAALKQDEIDRIVNYSGTSSSIAVTAQKLTALAGKRTKKDGDNGGNVNV